MDKAFIFKLSRLNRRFRKEMINILSEEVSKPEQTLLMRKKWGTKNYSFHWEKINPNEVGPAWDEEEDVYLLQIKHPSAGELPTMVGKKKGVWQFESKRKLHKLGKGSFSSIKSKAEKTLQKVFES